MKIFALALLCAAPAFAQFDASTLQGKQPCTATRTTNCVSLAGTDGTLPTTGVVFNAIAVLPPTTANAGRVLRYTHDTSPGACDTNGGGTSETLCRSAQDAAGNWHWVRVVEAGADGSVAIGTRMLPDNTVDLRTQGAKFDGRICTDLVYTAGSATATSATCNFTTADNPRVITAEMGAQGVASAVYVSGGTYTGAANKFCAVSSFNGGGSGAAGRLYLTGTNTIAASAAVLFTAPGTGYTSLPTTATLSSGSWSGTVTTSGVDVFWQSGDAFNSTLMAGATITINGSTYTVSSFAADSPNTHLLLTGSAGTQSSPVSYSVASATCSGTATISTSLMVYPVTTTATYVNATTLTLGTTATTSGSAKLMELATDDSAAWAAGLAAVSARGGGTLLAPCGLSLVTAQLNVPTTGAGMTGTIEKPVKIDGCGYGVNVYTTGQPGGWRYPASGTIVDLRYSGSGWKLQAEGGSYFELSNMALVDYGLDAVPFVHVNNANAFWIHDNLFSSAWSKSGAWGNNDQTAIQVDTGITGTIERNRFDRMKTGVVVGGVTTNGIDISRNYFLWSVGPGPLISMTSSAEFNTLFANNFEMLYVTAPAIDSSGGTYTMMVSNEVQDVGQTPMSAVVYVKPGPGDSIIGLQGPGVTTFNIANNNFPAVLMASPSGGWDLGSGLTFNRGKVLFNGSASAQIYGSGNTLFLGTGGVNIDSAGRMSCSGVDCYFGKGTTFNASGAGPIWTTPTHFSALGSPAAGKILYCDDCTVATTCAGSGTGAYAFRTAAGAWTCPF